MLIIRLFKTLVFTLITVGHYSAMAGGILKENALELEVQTVKMAHIDFQQAICQKFIHLFNKKSNETISEYYDQILTNIYNRYPLLDIKLIFSPELIKVEKKNSGMNYFIYSNKEKKGIQQLAVQCYPKSSFKKDLYIPLTPAKNKLCKPQNKTITSDKSFLEYFPERDPTKNYSIKVCDGTNILDTTTAIPLCKPYCTKNLPFMRIDLDFDGYLTERAIENRSVERDCRSCPKFYEDYEIETNRCIDSDGCPYNSHYFGPPMNQTPPDTVKAKNGEICRMVCDYGLEPYDAFWCESKSDRACEILDVYLDYLDRIEANTWSVINQDSNFGSCSGADIHIVWKKYLDHAKLKISDSRASCKRKYSSSDSRRRHVRRGPKFKPNIASFREFLPFHSPCHLDILVSKTQKNKKIRSLLLFSFASEEFLTMLRNRKFEWHYQNK